MARVRQGRPRRCARYEFITSAPPTSCVWRKSSCRRRGPGEARVRHRAIAVNYLDVYYRTGFYPPPPYPFTPGNEGAGEVVAIGKGVKGFKPGDRVAYVAGLGAYAEERNVEAKLLVKLPKSISYAAAAAMMMKGLTAQYLLRQTYRVKKGDVMLVHAAAGGVGQILCQWGKALGATVIATVGSADKATVAKKCGAKHVILYRDEDFAVRVGEITKGAKCHVVYDGVGKATFPRFARLPAPVRHVRQLRLRLGRHRSVQPGAAGAEGIAVRHPADAVHLPRRPGAARQDGARAVRRRRLGQGQNPAASRGAARRRRPRPCGAGGAPDDRIDRSYAVTGGDLRERPQIPLRPCDKIQPAAA